LRYFGWWLALGLWWGLWANSWADAPADPVGGVEVLAEEAGCVPRVLAMQAARATGDGNGGERPAQGWEDVQVPELWTSRWPTHDGEVWYRLDWQQGCVDGHHPVALGLDGVSVAGAVYLNGDLLWSDASLVEPLSRSWNMPRWWVLPASALREGVNSVWVRAVGYPGMSPGIGQLRLGDPQAVQAAYEESQWSQRTIYLINAVLAGMAALMFGMVWLLRRESRAYGCFALMALCWLAYLTTYLATTPWPFADSMMRSRASSIALIGFVLFAWLFTLRFGGQRLPRVERILWGLAAVGTVGTLAIAREQAIALAWVWKGTVLLFLFNCLQFQWHAWRPGLEGSRVGHRLLAVVWLVFVLLAINGLGGSWDLWGIARSWAAFCGLLIIALLMLLLGGQLVQQMRNVEQFNHELALGVAQARDALRQALEREHAAALHTAKLEERMRISHELHDGLGGSLVRGMALIEQSPQPLPHGRMLSLLKNLRDDLRQAIDSGSSAGALLPATPVVWCAPLRHRFVQLFDELGLSSQWHIAPQWSLQPGLRPSTLQCLGMTRVVEESLANVIKHSEARQVRVECVELAPGLLCLRVEDDGRGFDVQAVQQAGLSVGMRSMAARVARMGGKLSIQSSSKGTQVEVTLPLRPEGLENAPSRSGAYEGAETG
jgi:two-component system sensor histidine kinase UhpB